MSEVKVPTCGRVVHYFPGENDEIASHNGAQMVPAIVVQNWGNLSANLSVFPMNPDATNVLRYSVCHKSIAVEGQSYWDWPEIK